MLQDFIKRNFILLKQNFRLSAKNNLIIAFIYLCLVPVIRGISNLDALYSAQCLEQSVALIGIVLFVPVSYPEQDKAIQETLFSKAITYKNILLIRMIVSFLILLFSIGVFQYVMLRMNCTFPFDQYLAGTTATALFLGLVGLTFGIITNQVIIGYLAAIGLYLLNVFKIINEKNIFYLFSLSSKGLESKVWMMGVSFAVVVIILVFADVKSRKK